MKQDKQEKYLLGELPRSIVVAALDGVIIF